MTTLAGCVLVIGAIVDLIIIGWIAREASSLFRRRK